MRFVFVLSIPICSMALTLSEIRGPFPHARRLQDRNETWSEEMKLQFQRGNNTLDKYTSGFLRMDLFDWVRDVWIQAQVLPIGVCFNEGYAGGSAMLSEVIITDDTAFRSTNSYQSSDCTGEFIAYPYAQPVMDANRQLEQRISYVATYEEAVQLIPLNSDGLIVSSYYSTGRCTGNAAQYDIVSDRCSLYGYPIFAFGTFQCNQEAETMVMTLYGPFDDESFTFPVCTPQEQDDAATAYYGFDGYYSDGPQVSKQPFSCSDQSSFETEMAGYPYYQSVQCVTGVPESEPDTEKQFQDEYYHYDWSTEEKDPNPQP